MGERFLALGPSSLKAHRGGRAVVASFAAVAAAAPRTFDEGVVGAEDALPREVHHIGAGRRTSGLGVVIAGVTARWEGSAGVGPLPKVE